MEETDKMEFEELHETIDGIIQTLQSVKRALVFEHMNAESAQGYILDRIIESHNLIEIRVLYDIFFLV